MLRVLALALSAAVAVLIWNPLEPRAAEVTRDAQLGLPPLAVADQLAAERVALGRRLFMDPRLSRDGTMACATCHVPEQGFAFNQLATSIGADGRSLRRNAPTLLNVGYITSLFHDGRAHTLEEQVWGPFLAHDEMGNESREAVAARIERLSDYGGAFEHAFPGIGLTPDTIAAALAAYQRSLVSGGSRFDRFFYNGEVDALNASERRGYVLFRGIAHCDACHTLEGNNTLFTDNAFHNLGVGLGNEARVSGQPQSVPIPDEGRYEVTKAAKDRFAYRTPTLRNVELTAPYMHDGSLATLRDVVDFYDRGGHSNPGLDDFMFPLFLSEREKEDLVAFMRTLTGANVEQLARAARAAASSPSPR